MKNILQWINDNRDWLFEGAGLTLVIALAGAVSLFWKKLFPNSKNNNLTKDNAKTISINQNIGESSPIIIGDNASVTITKYYGVSEFITELELKNRELQQKLQSTSLEEQDKRRELEFALRQIQDKFNNIQVAYNQEIQRREKIKEKLLELNKQLPSKRINNAIESLKEGNISEAEEILREVHERSKADAAYTAYLIGSIEEGKFKLVEASNWYNKAIGIDPDNEIYLDAAAEVLKGIDPDKALEYLRKELKILKHKLGNDSSEVSSVLVKLATLHGDNGNYILAIPLAEEALNIRKKLLGANDLSVADILTQLGRYYLYQWKIPDAEEVLNEALEIRKELLGKNHLDIAIAMDNLGVTYTSSEQHFDDAEELFTKALNIFKKYHKNNKLAIARCLDNLAAYYTKKLFYEKAEPLYKESSKIFLEIFGDWHVDVAINQFNMAMVYFLQDKIDEAEQYFNKSLKIKEKLFGKNHIETTLNMHHLAVIKMKRGLFDEAEKILIETLNIQKSILGKNHFNVLQNLHALADCYAEQKKFDKAESIFLELYKIYVDSVGEDHPSSQQIKNKIISLKRIKNMTNHPTVNISASFKIKY